MKKIVFYALCSMVLFACDKVAPKLTVTPSDIVLYSEGSTQITTNATDASYLSQDEFYASVEPSGVVTANKVGNTEIIVNSSYGSASIPVTILPKYSLYPDIDGLVGKSLSEVTRVLGSNYEESKDGMIIYESPTSYCDYIGATFSGGKCENLLAVVSTSHTSMLTKALIERYLVAGMQNDYYFFLNHDKDVLITLTVYTSKYLAVLYMENTSAKSDNNHSMNILKVFEDYIEFPGG